MPLDTRQLWPTLTAGLLNGLIAVVIAISFGTLIFSGPLAPHQASGIALALLSATVTIAVVAVLSSQRGMVAFTQDVTTVILSLMAASLATQLADPASDSAYWTVLAALAVATLTTALLFLLLSLFNVIDVVRALPYPVMGGLIAGTGWLLVAGGFSVMTGGLPMRDSLAGEAVARWGLGLALGGGLLLLVRRYRHFLILPGALAGAMLLFYSGVLIAGKPLDALQADGWLMGPFPTGGQLRLLGPGALDDVAWGLIVGEAGKIGTLVAIAAVTLVLNISGIELLLRRDIDLHHEVRAASATNLLTGLFGGLAGFHALSLTGLNARLKANNRLGPLLAAGVCGTVLLAGPQLLGLVPKALLGGMLVFLGLSFLAEWVWDAYAHLPRRDYGVVLLILVTIMGVGFLEGVLVGILAAVLLFVIDYSRLNVVQHRVDLASFRSTVKRPAAHTAVLDRDGAQVELIQLQGFIFFGSANQVLNRLRSRIEALRFIVLDFRRVQRLDTSALYSLQKLAQLASASQVSLIFSTIPASLYAQLADFEAEVTVLPDLDRAVAHCEEQLIAQADLDEDADDTSLQSQMRSLNLQEVRAIMQYLSRREVPAGTLLARQGTEATALYFVESGRLSVQLEVEGVPDMRIRTVLPGTVVGEVGVYLDVPRTASIVAEEDSIIFELTRTALARMRDEQPALAAAFHSYIANLLATRLRETTHTLTTVLR